MGWWTAALSPPEPCVLSFPLFLSSFPMHLGKKEYLRQCMSQQPTMEERLRAGSPQRHQHQGIPELSKSPLCPTPTPRPFLSDLAT